MLLFRDQIQDSYSGSSRNVLIRDLRSYQTLDPKPHTRFFVSPSLLISCFRSSDQEPGRGASEPRTKLLALERSPALSKDGSMILDDGRGTSLPLLTLFSEDGGRRTEDVSLRSSNLSPLTSGLYQGRVHDPGRWTRDVSSALNALLGGRRTDNGERLFKKWSLSLFLCSNPYGFMYNLIGKQFIAW